MYVKVTGVNHWTEEEVDLGTYSQQGLVFEHSDTFKPLTLYDAASRKAIAHYIGMVWFKEGTSMNEDALSRIFIQPVEF